MLRSKEQIKQQPVDVALFEGLAELEMWVGWRLASQNGTDALAKIPVNVRSGGNARSNDRRTWATLREVEAAVEGGDCEGVGIQIIEDVMVFVDIDDCRQEDSSWDPRAIELVDLCDTYAEQSVSQTGIHILGFGKVPKGAPSRFSHKGMEVELYAGNRYATVSGVALKARPLADCQALVNMLCAGAADAERVSNTNVARPAPIPHANVDVRNGGLLDRLVGQMLASANGGKIRTLMDGDTSQHGGDHSRADFALCSHLAFWTGAQPQLMDAIFRQSGLMRPKWDERRGALTYGQRTIQRACDSCEDVYEGPAALPDETSVQSTFKQRLDAIHQRTAMVLVGNKVNFISESQDGRSHQLMNRGDLIEKHEADIVEYTDDDGRRRTLDPVRHWLRDPEKRTYERLVFKPAGCQDGEYNLFRGWGVQPAVAGSCDLFLEHVRTNLCQGDDDLYGFLMDWVAQIVQRPEDKHNTAVVLKGNQGTGKSIFAETIGHLIGADYFATISSIGQLLGRFNKQYATCMLMFADEALAPRDLESRGKLKNLISASTLQIEEKGKDPYTVDNFTRFIFASNNDAAIPAENNERRYFVLEVSNARQNDTAYFRRMTEQLRAGGYQTLMKLLLERPLTNNLRVCPRTQYLMDQIEQLLDPLESWLLEMVASDELAGIHPLDSLYEAYLHEMTRLRQPPITKNWFSRKLEQVFPHAESSRRRTRPDDASAAVKQRFINFGTTEQCTEAFELHTGMVLDR